MIPFPKLRQQTNRAAIEILFTDIRTAFTFLRVAETTGDPETRQRNWRHARRAYDSVTRFSTRFLMTEQERRRLETELGELRQALEAVGYVFDGNPERSLASYPYIEE
jgi:hypothetical protein